MSEPNKVERVSRQVIQRQLLDTLEQDKSVVAVLLTEEDLSLVEKALNALWREALDEGGREKQTHRIKILLDGLKQLSSEAFGK